MRSEKVTFPGSAGTPLAGRLDLPDAQPRAFAIFAHCFTCSKDVLTASRIAQALTGYASLSFLGGLAEGPRPLPCTRCGSSSPLTPG